MRQVPDEHRAFVAGLMDDFGVPELEEGYEFGDIVDGEGVPVTGNHTYTAKDNQPLLDVCLASGITLFANALGVAPTETIDAFHERGMLVAGLAGTARHGEKHREAGTDIVIAQGYEAGGHTGEIGTMVLIPDVVDAVEGTPVLAAGGIASGRQMAAAMTLGAAGVWTGSVWLTSEEAETTDVVREKFVGAVAADTVRSRACTGRPARQLRSGLERGLGRRRHRAPRDAAPGHPLRRAAGPDRPRRRRRRRPLARARDLLRRPGRRPPRQRPPRRRDRRGDRHRLRRPARPLRPHWR